MANNPRWTDEELVLAVELIDRRGWRGGNSNTQDYIELSTLLRAANFPGHTPMDPSFRSTSSVSLKMGNLVGAHPDLPGGLRVAPRDRRIVEQFLDDPSVMRALANTLRAGVNESAVSEGDEEELDDEEAAVASEGGPAYVLTLRRERSRALRLKKIRQVERTRGVVACEACSFDFFTAYGDLGRSYIEVHHRTPLHVSGETESALDDLALLCANCHRMVHRRGWLPVETVAQLVASMRTHRSE